MSYNPLHGHAALRRGRFSQARAEYFLTICTNGKLPGLANPMTADALIAEARKMTDDGTWRLRCLVVMPDHLHLLVNMGQRLSLEKAVQRLKAKTSRLLRDRRLSWERGFFDRKLRMDDERLSVFLYLFLNPYRAGLIGKDERWAYYFCAVEDWAWFSLWLDHECPQPAWLDR